MPPRPKKDETIVGYTGFYPRHIRDPVSKLANVIPPGMPKPSDPRPGYTGKHVVPEAIEKD